MLLKLIIKFFLVQQFFKVLFYLIEELISEMAGELFFEKGTEVLLKVDSDNFCHEILLCYQ